MSLERLVDEIRHRTEAEIARERTRYDAEAAKLTAERDRRIAANHADAARQTDLEVARSRAQRLARAKLEARQKVFEAREARMGRFLTDVRGVLADYAKSDDYPALMKRLYGHAVSALGKQIKVSGRSDDAPLLKSLAGRSYSDEERPILGGLIAESSDGARRLDLSFDELLRLRENGVRSLLTD